jgi:tetratricopeptide (TPR) repeat protein
MTAILDEIEAAFNNQAYQVVIDLVEVALANGMAQERLLVRGGLAHAFLGQFEEAIGFLQKAVALSPNAAMLRNNLGNVYAQAGKLEAAQDAYHHAIRMNPESPFPYIGLGNVLVKQGHHREAVRAFGQALDRDATLAFAYTGLGTALQHLGRLEDALEAYRQAVSLDPEDVATMTNLGEVLAVLNDPSGAIQAFQHAIRLNPAVVRPYLGLGKVYDTLGWLEEAAGIYQTAIAVAPNAARAYLGLGQIALSQGKNKLALAAFQKALQNGLAEDPAVHHGVGQARAAQGQFEEALSAFQKAIALDDGNSAFFRSAGTAWLGLEKIRPARKAFTHAIRLDALDSASYAALAHIDRVLGAKEKSAQWLRQAQGLLVDEGPYTKARVHAVAGNSEQALTHLGQALETGAGTAEWAAQDPLLASLQEIPAFQQLLREKYKEIGKPQNP